MESEGAELGSSVLGPGKAGGQAKGWHIAHSSYALEKSFMGLYILYRQEIICVCF